MSEHTGGDWEHTGRLIYSKEGMVCELSDPRASKYVAHKRLSLNSPDWDEAMNNGQLIQAAPKLLKACRTILAIYDLEGLTITSQFPLSQHSRRLRDAMDDMRKDVIKATGEAQDAG